MEISATRMVSFIRIGKIISIDADIAKCNNYLLIMTILLKKVRRERKAKNSGNVKRPMLIFCFG